MIKRAAFLFVIAVALPSAAGEPLAMRVSPRVALEPALLTVRTTVEADSDNRALQKSWPNPRTSIAAASFSSTARTHPA